MKIFLYEYTVAQAQPDALSAEGRAMFKAMHADLKRLADVEVLTLPAGTADEEPAFRALARVADYSLIIAPEFEGELERRCRWVEESGGRLLGPDPAAVALTADKLATFHHLQTHSVPTVPTWPAALAPDELLFPRVLKPRHGAGSQATFRVDHPADYERALTDNPGDGFIAQPFVPGLAASIAFLLGPVQRFALLPAEQHLSTDGRFHYEGGRLPLPPDLARRAEALGRRTVVAIAGLRGYAGVDLVLGRTPADDRVIEVNPRLTTSYVGVRELALDNLAEIMLRVVRGQPLAALRWREASVLFDSAGHINS